MKCKNNNESIYTTTTLESVNNSSVRSANTSKKIEKMGMSVVDISWSKGTLEVRLDMKS